MQCEMGERLDTKESDRAFRHTRARKRAARHVVIEDADAGRSGP